MIDGGLYAVMNWSMVVDGLLFWTLVLDFRPRPPARLSFGMRAAMAYATTFPEILIGTYLINTHFELYPFYSLCGRVFPWMDSLTDQRIGAAIIWIPPAMMSAAATLAVLIAFLHHDEAVILAREAGVRSSRIEVAKPDGTDSSSSGEALARSW
jgi:putative membrane protein